MPRGPVAKDRVASMGIAALSRGGGWACLLGGSWRRSLILGLAQDREWAPPCVTMCALGLNRGRMSARSRRASPSGLCRAGRSSKRLSTGPLSDGNPRTLPPVSGRTTLRLGLTSAGAGRPSGPVFWVRKGGQRTTAPAGEQGKQSPGRKASTRSPERLSARRPSLNVPAATLRFDSRHPPATLEPAALSEAWNSARRSPPR